MTAQNKYRLNIKRDVDVDHYLGEVNFILNLPYGFRFHDDIVHVRGYDTIAEIRQSIKRGEVIPCDCKSCLS
jgi:hypothetical protein